MAGRLTPDFTRYAVASRYAVQINAGYTASLCGLSRSPAMTGDEAAAWLHGYDLATAAVRGEPR